MEVEGLSRCLAREGNNELSVNTRITGAILVVFGPDSSASTVIVQWPNSLGAVPASPSEAVVLAQFSLLGILWSGAGVSSSTDASAGLSCDSAKAGSDWNAGSFDDSMSLCRACSRDSWSFWVSSTVLLLTESTWNKINSSHVWLITVSTRSLERLSIGCHKTKQENYSITLTNKNKGNTTRSQWELKLKAQENPNDQVANGFSFEPDWLIKWRQLF